MFAVHERIELLKRAPAFDRLVEGSLRSFYNFLDSCYRVRRPATSPTKISALTRFRTVYTPTQTLHVLSLVLRYHSCSWFVMLPDGCKCVGLCTVCLLRGLPAPDPLDYYKRHLPGEPIYSMAI